MKSNRQNSPTLILLAVFDGAPFLREQLESFLRQSDQNWHLIASDDGSTDNSVEILEKFQTCVSDGQSVKLLSSQRSGVVGNFFHLIRHIPEGTEVVALSDQDDVWLPSKLARGREALEADLNRTCPALYCASSFICDESLKIIGTSPNFRRPPSFRNALVQSIGGGNTMMLNRAAIELLKAAVDEAGEVVVHDWWIYQIITACGGRVIRDSEPVLFYRQHGGNFIGANTMLRAKFRRILFVSGRQFSDWNDKNIRALQASQHRFTEETASTLACYAAARDGLFFKRIGALWRSGVYRQRITGTVAFYLACLANKI